LQTLEALKRASCGWSSIALKRTGCDVVDNWNVRQAMSRQLFRVTTFCFNTCFQSFLILFGRIVHHAEVKFSPCRKAAVQQLLFVFFCHGYLTDLSTSSFRCSHFTLGNRKKSFLTLLFIYFRLFTLPQKKTSSNCCTAQLSLFTYCCLVLPIICIALVVHLGHAMEGARV